MKKMTKVIYLVVFGVLYGWMSREEIQAAERVESFHAEYTVNQDTSVSVQETIDYVTGEAKHGFFRYIPENYDNRGRTPVTWQRVTIDGGVWHPYTVEHEGGASLAKIGDPTRVFDGARTYELAYQVDFVVAQGDEGAELYWDLVGEDWSFTIEAVTATIRSPYAGIKTAKCYAGAFGSDNGQCMAEIMDNQTVKISYPHQVKRGENVTVQLIFGPENQLIFPGWWAQNRWWLLPVAVAGGVVLVMGAVLVGLSWRYRDLIFVNDEQLTLNPTGETKRKPFFYRQPKAFWYEPFKNITPGQAGFLLTGRFKSAQLVAEMLQLMEKKYLKIAKGEKSWLEGQDYTFEKLKEADKKLPAYQKLILEALFEKKDKTTLNEVKKTFLGHLVAIKAAIGESLKEKGFFERVVTNLKLDGGQMATLLGGGLGVMISRNYLTSEMWTVAMIGFIVFGVALWAIGSTRYSALGSHYKYLVAGLKENLKYGKWRTEIQEKLLYVEEVLPFAVALEEADQLAQDMHELGLEQQTDAGRSVTHDMMMISMLNSGFVQSFSRDFNSTYAKMTSSGGGSGGGGGSAGGGGGGGGGGSW